MILKEDAEYKRLLQLSRELFELYELCDSAEGRSQVGKTSGHTWMQIDDPETEGFLLSFLAQQTEDVVTVMRAEGGKWWCTVRVGKGIASGGPCATLGETLAQTLIALKKEA